MDCRQFNEVQLGSLLGDASATEQHQAARHARDCEECRLLASGDRWLDAAFELGSRKEPSGFPGAHRRLASTLRERRAYCARVEGPFGPVFLARTERGLCRVGFRKSEQSFLRDLERREFLADFRPDKLTRESDQLEAYFDGRLKRFRMPLDLRVLTPFQRSVLDATARVPFGQVASYSEIARRIGRPEARRAVGSALGRNPVAIVIPCHRVVAANGGIGGYTGGLAIKRSLMRIEGIAR